MELKLRLMELNWQKSQCVKMIAADERTRNEVRVCGYIYFTLFHCKSGNFNLFFGFDFF